VTVPLLIHLANVSPGKLRPVREHKPRGRMLTPLPWLSARVLILAMGIVLVAGIFLGALLVRLGEHTV
jgi:hypothetical protein